MRPRIWFCGYLGVACFAVSCYAVETHGATSEELAHAVEWASSQEPVDVAKRFLPGVDYPAVVRRCLARDQKSFRHLFGLSVHADAAAGELQSAILAIVLKHVGDDFFATQLAKAAGSARKASSYLLRYELLDQTPTPYGMRLSHYPKVMRLLKQSNQSMKPTAPLRNNFSMFAIDSARGLSLSR